MHKHIEALKTAYASKDAAKLHAAARSLVTYDRKHPFAATLNLEAGPIVSLAEKICAAASLGDMVSRS